MSRLTADSADMARLGRFLSGRAVGMVLSGGRRLRGRA